MSQLQTTPAIETLTGEGSVPSTYRHYDKEIIPAAGIDLGVTYLKWYDIALAGEPISPDLQEEARAFLQTEAKRGALKLDDELGFVILHRCGESFYFLCVNTWRNNNELWSTVYYADEATGPGFHFFERPRTHLGTFCVWELGAVWHEQGAYKRFLSTERGDEALQAYLEDQYSGTV
jgi:hypothetical protein